MILPLIGAAARIGASTAGKAAAGRTAASGAAKKGANDYTRRMAAQARTGMKPIQSTAPIRTPTPTVAKGSAFTAKPAPVSSGSKTLNNGVTAPVARSSSQQSPKRQYTKKTPEQKAQASAAREKTARDKILKKHYRENAPARKAASDIDKILKAEAEAKSKAAKKRIKDSGNLKKLSNKIDSALDDLLTSQSTKDARATEAEQLREQRDIARKAARDERRAKDKEYRERAQEILEERRSQDVNRRTEREEEEAENVVDFGTPEEVFRDELLDIEVELRNSDAWREYHPARKAEEDAGLTHSKELKAMEAEAIRNSYMVSDKNNVVRWKAKEKFTDENTQSRNSKNRKISAPKVTKGRSIEGKITIRT